MRVAIRVRVLLFARLREQAGGDRFDLELPAGATVADAYSSLAARHPGIDPEPGTTRAAVNQEFAGWDAALADGDEVAFIPPVSGGADEAGVLVELTDQPLDPRRLEAAVARPGAGAICTFTGLLDEADAGMAESRMRAVADEIGRRWPESRVAMAHRTGRLSVGEASVALSISSPHRAEAIAACQWGIDRLRETGQPAG